MKTLRFALVLMILSFGTALYAGTPCSAKKASLPAPTGFSATADEDSVDASWDAVTGATKYSVEVVAHYDDCGMEQSFSFTVLSPETDISIPLEELQACSDYTCETMLDAQGVEIRVKALNPPRGKEKEAQCNPFSDTVSIDFCGDGIDGNCNDDIDEDCDCLEGGVCGTYETCGDSGPTGICFVGTTAEGGCGACVENDYCANLTACESSDDCGVDEVCVVNTCCLEGEPSPNVCSKICGSSPSVLKLLGTGGPTASGN